MSPPVAPLAAATPRCDDAEDDALLLSKFGKGGGGGGGGAPEDEDGVVPLVVGEGPASAS